MRTRTSIALLLCLASVCVAQRNDSAPPIPVEHLSSISTAPIRAVDACAALNQVEIWAVLHGHDGVASMQNQSPDKKVSSCFQKRALAGGTYDEATLRAAAGPEIILVVSEVGGPAVVDSKAAASETIIPALGDHATILAGPMTNDPSPRRAYRVAVTSASRSYALIYSPDLMNQESRDVAVQLAREVLLGDFKGQLDSYPIAEQLIASDKIAVGQKPDNFELWNEIGLFSQYLKRYDDARDAYLRISQLLPNDPGGYLGVAASDLAKVDREKLDLAKRRGIAPNIDIATDAEYREVCEILRTKTRDNIDEAYSSAKKATQLEPEVYFQYWILSLIARQKASTDCGNPVAAKADVSEADHFAELSREKSKAAAMSGKSNVPRIEVALEPPHLNTEMGGVIGGIVSQMPAKAPSGVVPQRVRVAQGASEGLLLRKVEPVYPQLARQARVQGAVILQALISRDGNVEDLQLISGHPMLVQAAIEAVKQWKYKPYTLNGAPVALETQVQVNFSLSVP